MKYKPNQQSLTTLNCLFAIAAVVVLINLSVNLYNKKHYGLHEKEASVYQDSIDKYQDVGMIGKDSTDFKYWENKKDIYKSKQDSLAKLIK